MNIIEVIKSGDYLVLDTETTGLGDKDEICQITIIDSKGKILMDTLVKPVKPIPAEATAIHGITNEMVELIHQFPHKELNDILYKRNIIVYNADYDVRMLYQSAETIGLGIHTDWKVLASFYCAMKHFSQIYGDWNDYYKSYRWQKLSTACAYYKIPITKKHGALEDCLLTLEVCRAMVGNRKIEEIQGELPF